MFQLIVFSAIFLKASATFFDENNPATKTVVNSLIDKKNQKPTNLGCFLCKQLLSVTKHRMGMSQSQLKLALYDKCHHLPLHFREHCFRFVDTSLPEIYYTVNYDLTTKHVCISLGLCNGSGAFVDRSIEPDEITTDASSAPVSGSTTLDTDRTTPITVTTTTPPITASITIAPSTTSEVRGLPSLKPPIPGRLFPVGIISQVLEPYDKIGPKPEKVDSKLTCIFCERMLSNAKIYSLSAKADITSFANTVCSKLPSGSISDGCYKLAERKIAELSEFVDLQVAEALWCAELNSC